METAVRSLFRKEWMTSEISFVASACFADATTPPKLAAEIFQLGAGDATSKDNEERREIWAKVQKKIKQSFALQVVRTSSSIKECPETKALLAMYSIVADMPAQPSGPLLASFEHPHLSKTHLKVVDGFDNQLSTVSSLETRVQALCQMLGVVDELKGKAPEFKAGKKTVTACELLHAIHVGVVFVRLRKISTFLEGTWPSDLEDSAKHWHDLSDEVASYRGKLNEAILTANGKAHTLGIKGCEAEKSSSSSSSSSSLQ